jgi:hypothetical protein
MNIPNYILENILIGLIVISLFYVLYYTGDNENKQEVVIDGDSYEDFPLIAWFDTEEKWDKSIAEVVKIKYRVFEHNSRIWVYDENNTVVHMQPYDRDPKDDGSPRDFIYSWRLYKSEFSDEIEPGNYTITVGYVDEHTGSNQRKLHITI